MKRELPRRAWCHHLYPHLPQKKGNWNQLSIGKRKRHFQGVFQGHPRNAVRWFMGVLPLYYNQSWRWYNSSTTSVQALSRVTGWYVCVKTGQYISETWALDINSTKTKLTSNVEITTAPTVLGMLCALLGNQVTLRPGLLQLLEYMHEWRASLIQKGDRKTQQETNIWGSHSQSLDDQV